MIDNWTPEQQDIDWTQEHFNSMAVGDTWSVSGALIEKISDTELSLRQYPAEAALAAERVAKVCGEMGVVFNTEDAELIDDPMASAVTICSSHGKGSASLKEKRLLDMLTTAKVSWHVWTTFLLRYLVQPTMSHLCLHT